MAERLAARHGVSVVSTLKIYGRKLFVVQATGFIESNFRYPINNDPD